MGISAINGATFITQQAERKQPTETAGTLAFGAPETAGSLANNVGGSFCAMA